MRPARPVRLVGVSAEKTGEDNFEQMDLLPMPRGSTSRKSSTAPPMRCAAGFGGAAVTRATLLTPDTRKPEALSAANSPKGRRVEFPSARLKTSPIFPGRSPRPRRVVPRSPSTNTQCQNPSTCLRLEGMRLCRRCPEITPSGSRLAMKSITFSDSK